MEPPAKRPRKLEGKNRHIKDDRIRFFTEGHRYEVDFKNDGSFSSDDILSVTTILKLFFPEFNKDAVIAKMMANKNFEKNHKDLIGLTPDQIKDKWSSAGTESQQMGSRLHEEIECVLNEEKELVCTTPELVQFKEFTEAVQKSKAEPYRTEMYVFTDDDTRIAGSIDCVYVDTEKTLGFNPGNYLFVKLTDWKRVKALKKFSYDRECGTGPFCHVFATNFFEYSIQQTLYKYILENYYEKPTWNGKEYSKFIVDKMYLCQLHPSKKRLNLEECRDYTEEVKEVFALRKESLARKRNGEMELYPFDKNSTLGKPAEPEQEFRDFDLI